MITGIPYFGENNNEIIDEILSSPIDTETTANSLYDFVIDNIENPIVIIIDDKWLTWLNDIQFNYRDKTCYIPYYTYDIYELADKEYRNDNKGHLILKGNTLYIRHNYSLNKFDIEMNNLSLLCYNLDTSEKFKVNINCWFNSGVFDLDLLYKLYINSCFSDKDFLGLHDSGYHYISRAPRGFRNRVRLNRMAIMAGIIKLSVPKTIRQTRESPSPRSAGTWFLSFIHCSMKITTNMAVMTKSSPSVLKWSREPKMAPRVAPRNQ